MEYIYFLKLDLWSNLFKIDILKWHKCCHFVSGSLVFRHQNDQPFDCRPSVWRRRSLWHHEHDWLVKHKCLSVKSQPFSALHWQSDRANQYGCTQRSSDWKQEKYPCGWKNHHTKPANGICCLFCTFSGNNHLHSGYPLTKLQKMCTV